MIIKYLTIILSIFIVVSCTEGSRGDTLDAKTEDTKENNKSEKEDSLSSKIQGVWQSTCFPSDDFGNDDFNKSIYTFEGGEFTIHEIEFVDNRCVVSSDFTKSSGTYTIGNQLDGLKEHKAIEINFMYTSENGELLNQHYQFEYPDIFYIKNNSLYFGLLDEDIDSELYFDEDSEGESLDDGNYIFTRPKHLNMTRPFSKKTNAKTQKLIKNPELQGKWSNECVDKENEVYLFSESQLTYSLNVYSDEDCIALESVSISTGEFVIGEQIKTNSDEVVNKIMIKYLVVDDSPVLEIRYDIFQIEDTVLYFGDMFESDLELDKEYSFSRDK
ncbi:hypothetical protein [Marinicella sp. W31]|uniref:hypothetical protein n=1 Tax=Marinicella sp. W31 TaxID=3023713 RepID=UPI0037570A03